MIGDDEVGMAVVVHVGESDVIWQMAGRKWRSRSGAEGSPAVTEQYRDGTGVGAV